MDKSYKRKNNYYRKPGGGGGSNSYNYKKKFRNYLAPGMKGFLCTCNTREADCVRESYNILNEYADKLFGSNEFQNSSAPANSEEAEGAGGDVAEDIEDELKKEVSSLKASQRTPGRFNAVDTGVKNNVFIKTMLEDPVKLGYAILNDIATTKTQKARFLLRIVPVEVTCKANLEDIKSTADTLFDKHFRCEPTTFAVVINKRYNDGILRDDVITSLALLVTDKNRDHKANLKDGKYTVLVEIMKNLCCMSVLEDYKKLRHYNLAELAKPESSEGEKAEAEKPADEAKEDKESDGDEAADEEVGKSETVEDSSENAEASSEKVEDSSEKVEASSENAKENKSQETPS